MGGKRQHDTVNRQDNITQQNCASAH